MAGHRRGRPLRVPGLRSNRRLEIRLTPFEYAQVRTWADVDRTSISDFCRLAILGSAADQADGDVPIVASRKGAIYVRR